MFGMSIVPLGGEPEDVAEDVCVAGGAGKPGSLYGKLGS